MATKTTSLVILPGGSSPFHPDHAAVYDLLIEQATSRQWESRLLSYVGEGQYPDFGRGLDLAINAASIRQSMAGNIPDGSVLFCRCYGCYVGAYLLAFHPGLMASFRKIVFWAPATYWYMWKCAYADRDSLGEFNEYARTRGYVMADSYFQSLLPMECLATRFNAYQGQLVLACGTDDPSCRVEDIEHLAGIVAQWTSMKPETSIVQGARHAVLPEDSGEVVGEYLNVIFE